MLKHRGSLTDSDYVANHNLDIKYEMFLKWLQHVENNAPSTTVFRPIDERMQDNGYDDNVITSDEDNDDDFVDTDADYPTISFTDTESISGGKEISFVSDCSESNLNSTWNDCVGKSTLELLTARLPTDYDSSASEFSAVTSSEKSPKRRAMHNKGKAPPVPSQVPLSTDATNNVDQETAGERKHEKKPLISFIPNIFRSHSPLKQTFPEKPNEMKLETDI